MIHRIAVEELEAWYFGDWEAVRAAYPNVPASLLSQAKYRDPDAIRGGTWESFERVMQASKYFRGGLRKLEVAERIAPHLDPARSKSPSFRVFCQAIEELSAAGPPG